MRVSRRWYDRVFILAMGTLLSAAMASAATFTVDSTGDEPDDNTTDNVCHTAVGTCTLRAALMQASATAGADIIHFNIPGGGVHTIRPTFALPSIDDPVTIDGYSQPGSSPNTLAVGDNAVLTIEIDGSLLSGVVNGLSIFTNGCTVRGLVINRFTNPGIVIDAETGGPLGGHTIQGNFIGTNPAGTAALGNTGIGLFIRSPNNLVGGPSPADRNLISGTTASSPNPFVANLEFSSASIASINGNVVQGNYIGTDATGTLALSSANGATGLSVLSENPAGGGVIIGGSAAGAGNVISGNALYGVEIQTAGNCLSPGTATGVVVEGNRIGTDVHGAPLGNGFGGVHLGCGALQNTIGGIGAGAGNVIAYNGAKFNNGGGVVVEGGPVPSGNAIRGNSIFANTSKDTSFALGLGIDLGRNGPTANDSGDGDSGPNHLQNYPILTAITYGASTTRIQGTLNSAASTNFDLDFYSSPPCLPRPRDLLEGETYLGSTTVATDGSGNASIDVTLPVAVAGGSPITSTATDPGGNTSEFSQALILTIVPNYGPASGNTNFSLNGYHFLAGLTVKFAGVAATGINFFGFNGLSGQTPPLPPGSVADVTIDNTDGTSGILRNAFVADFLDVPSPSATEKFIANLVASGITAGCGGGNFCPLSNVSRAQMAVFLLRSERGLCYTPPPATGTVFADVPAVSFAAAWIEALAAAQVTGGCGGGNYCPGSSVTRDQMAVFLLRTAGGPSYVPPACVTPTFNDVPCSSPFSRWIEELVRRGITAGCGGGNYCPTTPVTRGQMAVFLTTTFALP